MVPAAIYSLACPYLLLLLLPLSIFYVSLSKYGIQICVAGVYGTFCVEVYQVEPPATSQNKENNKKNKHALGFAREPPEVHHLTIEDRVIPGWFGEDQTSPISPDIYINLISLDIYISFFFLSSLSRYNIMCMCVFPDTPLPSSLISHSLSPFSLSLLFPSLSVFFSFDLNVFFFHVKHISNLF